LMKVSCHTHPVVKLEYVHRRGSWVLGLPRPKGPLHGWTFFRGSQWILLNRRAAQSVLRADPAVPAWFRRSWIPDETYFQTLLHKEEGLVVRNEPVTYVLETPQRPTQGWMRLGMEDLPAMWASGAPFARKVDPVERPEVLNAIDEVVDRARSVARRGPGKPSG
jgi:hypothetical protein